jgi:ABC-type branched-subunit amino acid transport system permease subunit
MRRYSPLILLGAVTVGLAVLPMMDVPQTWLLYLFYLFVFLAAANMWNLLAGFSGLLALCPAAFIGLAGYAMTILTWLGIPFYVGIIAGGASAALFAMLISLSVFRMKGVYFAIGTLVVPAILRLVFLRWRPVGGDLGCACHLTAGVPSLETGRRGSCGWRSRLYGKGDGWRFDGDYILAGTGYRSGVGNPYVVRFAFEIRLRACRNSR